MSKRFGVIVGWLRHPKVTLASNLWFVIGAGISAAGLVGGVLAVLTTFPLVWLIVTVVGAFLLATGGISMVVRARGWHTLGGDPPEPGEEQQQQEQRQAIGRTLAELENARGAIERAASEREWWLKPLGTEDWNRWSDTLMKAGFDEAHKATRIAYRHITELNSLAQETREALVDSLMRAGADVPAGIRPDTGTNNARCWAGVTAVREAEGALEKAQMTCGLHE